MRFSGIYLFIILRGNKLESVSTGDFCTHFVSTQEQKWR